jgi:hypothetical protein
MKQKLNQNYKPKTKGHKAFEFIDYTDAELIAFYELMRNKLLGSNELGKHEVPGLAGKYKLLLARL